MKTSEIMSHAAGVIKSLEDQDMQLYNILHVLRIANAIVATSLADNKKPLVQPPKGKLN